MRITDDSVFFIIFLHFDSNIIDIIGNFVNCHFVRAVLKDIEEFGKHASKCTFVRVGDCVGSLPC